MRNLKLLTSLTLCLIATWNLARGQTTHFSVNSSTVALWTFNAHSNGTFLDASPNAFNLSNANNFVLTPSPYDSAVNFTGTAPLTTSYLTHAYASALTMGATGQMTFEVRLYLIPGQSGAGAGGGWVIGTYDGISLNIGSDGHFQAGGQKVRNGTGYWITETSVPGIIPLNRWVDLAVAFDNATGQAYGYIDGTPVQFYSTGTTNPITDPFRISTGAFFVGNNGRDNGYQFSGAIDEIRVSNNLVLGAGPPLIIGNPPSVAPSNLFYSMNPATYSVNTSITNNVPTVSGTANRYSVNPALPAGLKLDTITGVISGTPTVATASAGYTVTARNSLGSTTAIVNITVLAPSPPSNLIYSRNPATYGVGAAIAPNNPTITGSATISYSVSPALPAGLTLNASTGSISGTPTAASAATYYTLTATNSYGTTSTSLNITVIAAPSGLTYSVNPAQYAAGNIITPNTPSVTGTVIGYSVIPALPPGLTMDTTSGVISGTPTTPSVASNYVVTAKNAQGSSTTATLSITVQLAPSNLSYQNTTASYSMGTAIVPNSTTLQGTSPFTYSVLPQLPAGLTLNFSTGTISGTPTTVTPAANYVVTARNLAGSTTTTLSITVTPPLAIFHQYISRTLTLKIIGSSAMLFSLPEGNAQNIRLEILDMMGMKVWENNLDLRNGEKTVLWNGKTKNHAVSGGIYFARMSLMDAEQNPIKTTTRRFVYSP